MFRDLRRVYFSPEDGAPGADATPPAKPGEPAPEETAEQLKNSLAAARRREKEAAEKLQALTTQFTEIKTQLDGLKSEKLTAEQKLAAELEQTKAQLTELKPSAERWQKYEKAQEAKFKDLVEKNKVPEDVLSWVNQIPDINARLDAINTVLNPKVPPGEGITTPGQPKDLATAINNANSLSDIAAIKF